MSFFPFSTPGVFTLKKAKLSTLNVNALPEPDAATHR